MGFGSLVTHHRANNSHGNVVLDLSKLKVAAKQVPTHLGTIEESKKSGLINYDSDS